MKIYTKKGDDGTTGLLYGGRVPKDSPRTSAYGSVDEANALLGWARAVGLKAPELDEHILRIQRELFILGAELATAPENAGKLEPGSSKVTPDLIEALEAEIDAMTEVAPLPNYFIVPGACEASAALDVARSVVRRAERGVAGLKDEGALADEVVLHYLNRLSDHLFVAARFEEHHRGLEAPASKA